MMIYLRKDVPKVGLSGEIVTVSDGFGKNYLLPQNLGIEITEKNKEFYENRRRAIENRKEAIATETSMLAEKIKSLTFTIKRKMHGDNKLYGSVSPTEIADLLAQKNIKVAKNQVIIPKPIKQKGEYTVTIKLSSRLQPSLTVKVLPE